MVRRLNGRPIWVLVLAVITALGVALPALAQSTAVVRGVVTDDKGQPAENAKVSFDLQGPTPKHFESKTNRQGQFTQAGLPSGDYKVTAEKDKLSAAVNLPLRAGNQVTANLKMSTGGAALGSAATAISAALKKAFDEGLAASNAGNHDEAIAKFTEALTFSQKCNDCYDNIGFSYTAKKEYDKAEEAYKKAIEVKADDAAAYNGLANLYNAQRKFDEAAAASAKATELSAASSVMAGGNADALFNQGVILWNSGKIPEAKKSFEAAVAANPNHAESHYQLGMALLNEGNMAGGVTEFETYLKLAPTGPNAATAKSMVDQLKK